jgi:hypothetical protein
LQIIHIKVKYGTFIVYDLIVLYTMRRTRTDDYINIERATDLEWVVFDKRHLKRANKKKATRRNRRYKNNLLNYLAKKIN